MSVCATSLALRRDARKFDRNFRGTPKNASWLPRNSRRSFHRGYLTSEWDMWREIDGVVEGRERRGRERESTVIIDRLLDEVAPVK